MLHLYLHHYSKSSPSQDPSPQTETAQVAQPPPQTSKVLASAAIRLYQLNPQTNAYDAVGGGNPLGCVIMGMGVAYQILVYDGQVLCYAIIDNADIFWRGQHIYRANSHSHTYTRTYAPPRRKCPKPPLPSPVLSSTTSETCMCLSATPWATILVPSSTTSRC